MTAVDLVVWFYSRFGKPPAVEKLMPLVTPEALEHFKNVPGRPPRVRWRRRRIYRVRGILYFVGLVGLSHVAGWSLGLPWWAWALLLIVGVPLKDAVIDIAETIGSIEERSLSLQRRLVRLEWTGSDPFDGFNQARAISEAEGDITLPAADEDAWMLASIVLDKAQKLGTATER